jgi:hypothetical protein
MRFLSIKALLAAMVLLLAASSVAVNCFPSGHSYPPTGFTYKNGDWYDSWGFDRNYYGGSDGFMPNLVYETVGANKELAYSIGDHFKTSYSSDVQRAVAILEFVQRWTEYGYDVDNVVVRGVAQEEWAWNADEMAHMFNVTTNTIAVGDCEDMAFLCATIYIGAGYDVAMIDAPEHAALLIWLPEYPNANYYWDLGDGRGAGWIWVEATGEENPLGWTPPDFDNGDWTAYSMNSVISNVNYSPNEPQAEDDVTVTVSVSIDSSQISRVQLTYSLNGGAYRTLTMALSGSLYMATIPKQSTGTVVEFQVSVTDTEGNVTESGKISYTVGGGGGGFGFDIPGFPFESILIGLVIGLAMLYFLSRKKSALPGPGASVHYAVRRWAA